MAKKAKKVAEIVEEIVEEVKEDKIPVETFTEHTVSRRGRPVTIRTYADGKIEEL